MSAARSLPTVKRDVLLGMVAIVMLATVAGIVFGQIESASALLTLGVVLVGCLMTIHWLIGGLR